MELQEPASYLDCLALRCRLEDREAADDLLRFGERPVGNRHLALRDPHADARPARPKAPSRNHRSILQGIPRQLVDGVEQRLWRRPLVLSRLHDRKEPHDSLPDLTLVTVDETTDVAPPQHYYRRQDARDEGQHGRRHTQRPYRDHRSTERNNRQPSRRDRREALADLEEPRQDEAQGAGHLANADELDERWRERRQLRQRG